MAEVNRQWLLGSRPQGMVQESNFQYNETSIPALSDLNEGQFLVRNCYISFEPAMRDWMNAGVSYAQAIEIGDVMLAITTGQVIASKHPDYQPGDCVHGAFGWQEYIVTNGEGGLMPASKIPKEASMTMPLGVLGLTGLTAYFGLLEIGEPKPGQTCVVSGAAGATGSVAGQIAKIKGCRVIGIAGGAEKCAWLTHDAHFDAAIDYKSEDVAARLQELCPDGINIFFDNVGGEILDAVLDQLALNARIVLCGAISRYNDAELQPGPRNYFSLIIQRARMEGFLLSDYFPRVGEAVAELLGWLAEGKIVHQEDIQAGFENAPQTFFRLFEGKNLGKQLLKIADLPLERN